MAEKTSDELRTDLADTMRARFSDVAWKRIHEFAAKLEGRDDLLFLFGYCIGKMKASDKVSDEEIIQFAHDQLEAIRAQLNA